MKVVVLSLEKSVERRTNISSYLNGLNIEFEFFNAIDGSIINRDDLTLSNEALIQSSLKSFCGELKPTEMGCALSHIEIYKYIVSKDYDLTLVLEDDIIFTDLFIKLYRSCQFNVICNTDTDLLLLGFHRALGNYHDKAHLVYGNNDQIAGLRFSTPICCYFGAYGYFISAKGAQKLLEVKQTNNFVMKSDNFINYAWFLGLRLKVFEIPIIFPGELGTKSTINTMSELNKMNSDWAPKFKKIDGLMKFLFYSRIFFFKARFVKPLFLKKKYLSIKNFDEISGVFYTFK